MNASFFAIRKSKLSERQLFRNKNYLSEYLKFLYLLAYLFLLVILETSIKKTDVNLKRTNLPTQNSSVEQRITLTKKIIQKVYP